MIMYVGHMLSLLIYVAIIATTVNCYISMQKVHFGHTLTIVLYTFIVSLFCQASSFLMLQIDWITMDYNDAVGDLTALGWLAFDYFNGFALLSFATATNIYLKWRKNMDEHSEFHYRRRLEDFPP